MSFIKNISKSEVLTLKEEVAYQKGPGSQQDPCPE